MKTIKFRQKILDGNGNKSFHYWGFMRNGSFVPPIKSENGTYWTALKDSEQFTGLKDKNGKEIFESDILDITIKNSAGFVFPAKYRVVYGAGGFDIQRESYGEIVNHRLGEIPNGGNEVIGNIYENKNLLKEEK